MITKKSIYQWLYIIFFVCVDVMIIVYAYKTYHSFTQVDDIFTDFDNLFYFLTGGFIFGPFLVSQPLCLRGCNALFKRQLQGSQKYFVLAATAISGLILVGYLILQSLNYIPNNIKITKPSNLLIIVWLITILSLVLYAIGKSKTDQAMESKTRL